MHDVCSPATPLQSDQRLLIDRLIGALHQLEKCATT
jgi:hypothetical protein